jgi:tetratricopeptide (TPR) repeat protein
MDQKRTKRTVQVVAIIAAIGFAGVIFVVLALIIFGGGSGSPADQVVDDAMERVEATPRDAAAWDDLASAYMSAQRSEDAVRAARRAVELAPRNFEYVQTLVTALGDDDEAIITALQDFTRRNPTNAEAFVGLGLRAQSANRIPLAKLSYQAYLRLQPNGSLAPEVRATLDQLENPTPTTPEEPAEPPPPPAPETPVTP